MHDIVAGLDEAGRGAVLGPLVLVVVFASPEQIAQFGAMGVCDSKKFGAGPKAQKRRRDLSNKIRATALSVGISEASAADVDRAVRTQGLNRLEQDMAARLLHKGPPFVRAVADGQRLFSPLARTIPRLYAMDRADRDDPVVAAASIVAKDLRDQRMAEILAPHEKRFGPIGGNGYANLATARFIKAYHAAEGRVPDETRKQWQWPVLQELLGVQRSLFDR